MSSWSARLFPGVKTSSDRIWIRLKSGGLTLGNLMIAGFPNTRYGRPGRDEEIEKVQQSIRAAGRAGLPVVEYNFYAHRLVEGYDAETGRAGAGLTAFDYSRVKDLPPLEPGVKPKAFAVTVEPAGGVPKPTGRMVMVGTVS